MTTLSRGFTGPLARNSYHRIVSLTANTTIVITIISFILTSNAGNTTPLQFRVNYRRGYLVGVGETINLTCPYTTPFYKWTPATQTSWILSEDQVYSLKAESVTVSGTYICSAVNGFGHNSAEFNIKVIDKSSTSQQENCALLSNGHLSESGPCFLNTYSEARLSETKVWGDDVGLDCESVAVEGLTERLAYTWNFYPHSSTVEASLPSEIPDTYGPTYYSKERRRTTRTIASTKETLGTNKAELVFRFTGSILRISKLTLANAGEYRCSVSVEAQRGDPPSGLTINKLTRTFQLHVKPRSEGAIIQGPHNVTATVELGRDATFTCEINEEEHRVATIRWGKHVTVSEIDANDLRTNEVLRWSGGTYVVLPSIQPQDLQQFFDIPKPLALSRPGSRRSRLVLRSVSTRDAGLYICSVITESGRDDHKFVHVSLRDGNKLIDRSHDTEVATSRHLTMYITVPIGVFLICVCAVVSLLVRNRTRQSRQCNQRGDHKSPLFSPGTGTSVAKYSLNPSQPFHDCNFIVSSPSISFTRSGSPPRNGRSIVSSKVVPQIQMQLHPSPMNSLSNVNTSQKGYYPQCSPGHIQQTPSYAYPSSATEYDYFSTDGTPMVPPYVPLPMSTHGLPPRLDGHMPNADYQICHTAVSGRPNLSYPRSGDSNDCDTDLGFDQAGNPFFTMNSQEPPNIRVPCVSPSSSGKEHLPVDH